MSRIANTTALLARIGADPQDDEDLRQKKALLVQIAVLIAPISVVWGVLYLALGALVGIAMETWYLEGSRSDRARSGDLAAGTPNDRSVESPVHAVGNQDASRHAKGTDQEVTR